LFIDPDEQHLQLRVSAMEKWFQHLQLLSPNVCTPVLYMFEHATTPVWEEINDNDFDEFS
jgi:hypothetical protein